MKKLTIEEKEKAYDEAIKKLRDFYRDYDTVSRLIDVKEELANMFPELKESDESRDERIRKNCIHFLELQKQHHAATFEIEECIDWLEKQGEQKPTDWKPQTGDIFRKKGTTYPTYHLCDKREDGITFGFVENREVGISGGEITIFALRQDYELVERPKSIEDVVEEEFNKALQTKGEQKTADKYKEWYDFIRWFVKQRTDDYTLIPSDDDIHKWGDNILNHARKVLEQKPAWSEEDEKEVAVLEAYIRSKDWSESHIDRALGIVDELVNKVKSLRPQTRWKPSEEQMDAVKSAALDVAKFSSRSEQLRLENEPYYKALMSLYNDLEKLRG